MSYTWIFSFISDTVFFWFYFRSKDKPSRRKNWLILFLLLALLPVYASPDNLLSRNSYVRITYRLIIYFLILYWVKKFSWSAAAYIALIWTSIYSLFQNIIFGPFFPDIYADMVFIISDPFWNQMIIGIGMILIRYAFFSVIAVLLPLSGFKDIKLYNIVFLAVMFLIIAYAQESVKMSKSSLSEFPEPFSTYYLLLQATMLLFILALEYIRRKSLATAAMALQNQTSQALLEQIEGTLQSEQKIRALRHDLKNHALTIQLLLEEGNIEKAKKYIQAFYEEAQTPPGSFHTGNRLLDGLLRQKLLPAQTDQIQAEVTLDFSRGDFIDAYDLCVIMGNLLDNALEAAQKVEDTSRRVIKISGRPSANCLLIRIENPYSVTDTVDLTRSSKPNPVMHGYGLRNIRRVLDEYNGNLTFSQEDGRFVATVLIPIQ